MKRRRRGRAAALLQDADASLLDLVDHVLTKGVVVSGEVMLGLADVDLVYLQVSALLCAADRLMGARTPLPRAAPAPGGGGRPPRPRPRRRRR